MKKNIRISVLLTIILLLSNTSIAEAVNVIPSPDNKDISVLADEQQPLVSDVQYTVEFGPIVTITVFSTDPEASGKTNEMAYYKVTDNIYGTFQGSSIEEPLKFDYSEDCWQDYKKELIPGSGFFYDYKAARYSACKENNFTVSSPDLRLDGFVLKAWVLPDSSFAGFNNTNPPIKDNSIMIKPGESYTFSESTPKLAEGVDNYHFYPIYEYDYSDKIEALEMVVDGHFLSASINRSPAYTGSKIRGTDIFESIKIDGQDISPDKVKLKSQKEKRAGYDISIRIKKIKGLKKNVNKAIKQMDLGTVKFRPIIVSERTHSSKAYVKEGEIIYGRIFDAESTPKYVVVPKYGVYSRKKAGKRLKVISYSTQSAPWLKGTISMFTDKTRIVGMVYDG